MWRVQKMTKWAKIIKIGCLPWTPWRSRNTYQCFKVLQLDMQQSPETFITFALLEVSLVKNVCPFRPTLPWAVGQIVLALSMRFFTLKGPDIQVVITKIYRINKKFEISQYTFSPKWKCARNWTQFWSCRYIYSSLIYRFNV